MCKLFFRRRPRRRPMQEAPILRLALLDLLPTGRTSPYYSMRNNLACISTLKLFEDSASAMELVAGMRSI